MASRLTVVELKEALKKLGLQTSGKKDELLQRYLEATGGKADVDSDEKKSKGKGKQKKAEEEEDEKEEEDEDKKKSKRKAAVLDADDDDTAEPSSKKNKGVALSDDDILGNLTEEGWKEALQPEFSKSYFKEENSPYTVGILKFLEGEYAKGAEIFPPRNEIFSCFNYTPLDKVKVVILGQDPYHDNLQANGLCFSVRDGITHPPSLKNIFKEMQTDVPGFKPPKSGSLEQWAKRGVLLLNATLTVEAHKANSHEKCGWQVFTDAVIKVLNQKAKGVVFILWGGFAQKKGKIIDSSKHHVIAAAHPSPLSVKKFMGCKVFSKANAILEKEGLETIDWTL